MYRAIAVLMLDAVLVILAAALVAAIYAGSCRPAPCSSLAIDHVILMAMLLANLVATLTLLRRRP